jgi:hypothetical protein
MLSEMLRREVSVSPTRDRRDVEVFRRGSLLTRELQHAGSVELKLRCSVVPTVLERRNGTVDVSKPPPADDPDPMTPIR